MKKLLNYIKKNKILIITLSIFVTLFTTLTILVLNGKTQDIDKISHTFILNIRNNNLTYFFKLYTNIAGAIFLIIISTIIMIFNKNKKIALYVYINLISSWLINEIFKNIFLRERPTINLINETGLSYPSGHSMIGFAFYGFISYILYQKVKKKSSKIIIVFCFITLISLIGFSRIYLGVHYLTDIIGGFLLATIYLIIYIKCIKLEKK